MALRLGLREANQRFSKAIRAVKAGQEVILTERGEPIAVIKPLTGRERPDELLGRLQAAGLVRVAEKRSSLRPWRPRAITGRRITDTLTQERTDG